MAETLTLRGELRGHSFWLTEMATTDTNLDLILSSSRDQSIIVWDLSQKSENGEQRAEDDDGEDDPDQGGHPDEELPEDTPARTKAVSRRLA